MRVLVTGAAGLIGGEVARRLAERGHRVTAGVHRNRAVLGYDGAPARPVELLTIDVAAPDFGLPPAAARDLAKSHDLIVHCAATTRFDLAEAEYRAVNVGGTAHAITLARAGGAALLHVSTAYVCGARGGRVGEDDPLPTGGHANHYEASKAAGERLVETGDIRWAIARPSIVVGDAATGAIRCFDTIYAAFRLIAEGRIRHMPARAGASLDFVPIDHVAAGLVAIAENMDAASGGRYHLVSAQPIAVEAWAAAIGAYPQFCAPCYVDPASFDPATLDPRERRLFARVAAPYASYFQRDPRFGDAKFRALTGIAPPPLGEAWLRRLIDYCIAVGFLPAT